MDFRNETVFLVAILVALTVAVGAVMWATYRSAPPTIDPANCLFADTREVCK